MVPAAAFFVERLSVVAWAENEGVDQITVSLSIVRLQFDCPAVAGDCFVQLPLVLQSIAQVAVRSGVVGFEAQGRLIMRHRFNQLTIFLKGNAQVAVRIGEVGLEAQGRLILGYCVCQLSLSLQSIAQVVMKGRFGGSNSDRLVDVLDRLIHFASLTGHHPQQMKGIGIAGVHLQDLPRDRFRLLQVAQLMVAQRHG